MSDFGLLAMGLRYVPARTTDHSMAFGAAVQQSHIGLVRTSAQRGL